MTGDCFPAGVDLVASGSLGRASTNHDNNWCNVDAGELSYIIPVFETEHYPGNKWSCTVEFIPGQPPPFPVRGDGHSIFLETPNLGGGTLSNHHITVDIDNSATSWRKAKLNFHINFPQGITGIGGECEMYCLYAA